MSPVQIKVLESKDLFIKWNDKTESNISLLELRKSCPCATCMAEKDNQSSTYIPLYTSDQLKIIKIEMVGYYAIGITWKDGHNTGIYEFSFLKLLSNEK